MPQILQISAPLDNRTSTQIASPPMAFKVRQGWALESSPTNWPYPYWLWSIPGNFWLGAFRRDEAEQAIALLGDANQYPAHADAMASVENNWGKIVSGGAE